MRRLLLDTHVVLWGLSAPDTLSAQVRDALQDPANEVVVSAVSVWEVEIKRALGKLVAPDSFAAVCREVGFDELAISFAHAERAGTLPPHHSDPFDRMLIAQAMEEGLELVSRDAVFARYAVATVSPT